MNLEAQRLKDDDLGELDHPAFSLKYNWVARELDLTSRSIAREVGILLTVRFKHPSDSVCKPASTPETRP
jgi:hypothetical protein